MSYFGFRVLAVPWPDVRWLVGGVFYFAKLVYVGARKGER